MDDRSNTEEIDVVIFNHSDRDCVVFAGDLIVRIIICKAYTPKVQLIPEKEVNGEITTDEDKTPPLYNGVPCFI